MTASPKPPRGLRAPGRQLWVAVCDRFDMEPPEMILLASACAAADRAAEAKAIVDKDGVTIEGRYGPRVHPAVAVERASRESMIRILKELGYDPLKSAEAQTRAARDARWRAPQ